MRDYQPHTVRQTAEYSAPTFKENSAPFDTDEGSDLNLLVNGIPSILFLSPIKITQHSVAERTNSGQLRSFQLLAIGKGFDLVCDFLSCL
jgi:hypothetical protein